MKHTSVHAQSGRGYQSHVWNSCGLSRMGGRKEDLGGDKVALVDNLRRDFPALRQVTYLNTGSFGALPVAAAEQMKETMAQQCTEGREFVCSKLAEVQRDIREQLTSLFHVDANSWALTDSTAQGANAVLWGLALVQGDEILVTDNQHPEFLLPVFVQKQRRGVVVRRVQISSQLDIMMEALEAAVTSRTRLLVCSQVSYLTGHRLPVEKIIQWAHGRGILVLLDGSQGAGAEDLGLRELNADFYTFPGHKWLCGPEGTGALYVRQELVSMVEPTFVGTASLRHQMDWTSDGFYLPSERSNRFEYSTANMAVWVGWQESLKYLRIQTGWEYIFTRTKGLSGSLLDRLLDLPHVRVVTPRDARVGLVSFQVTGFSAARVVEAARQRGIQMKLLAAHNMVRVSTGFYNTEEELERLVGFLQSPGNW
ncbi:aminotransferase class V-fold PLP-dependent enzyme [Alicyclobacillaceae bacterium I2511]|nr:aminotransferase class V-fold PLP-dependent enzyme [Alicyclobacillaceae bacterium I2511]